MNVNVRVHVCEVSVCEGEKQPLWTRVVVQRDQASVSAGDYRTSSL